MIAGIATIADDLIVCAAVPFIILSAAYITTALKAVGLS
jgi:hypothetical protein